MPMAARGIGSAACDQTPEHRAVLEVVAGGQCRGVPLHALADRLARWNVETGHLALVANEGRDLAVDRVSHVDDDVRLIHAPVPELADLLGLQASAVNFPGKC